MHDGRRSLSTGRGGITLLAGPAGIGKTRLLTEFLRSVNGGRKPLVVRTECLEFGGVTFGPIREIVAALVASGNARLDAVAAEALERGSFFEAIEEILRTVSQKRAILICIEDLHWADRATLELLAFFATRIANARVRIFASFRDDEMEAKPDANAAIARMSRAPSTERVDLRPLADAEMKAILDEGLGVRATSSEGLVRNIVARAGGNPFYGEELLKSAIEKGSFETAALPQSIKASILERYAALDEVDRTILAHAAVLGYRFDPHALVTIFDFTKTAVARALARARSHLLVVEEALPAIRFRFRHALTHETIAGEMLALEARLLHARIARVLESRPYARSRVEEIAYHWWKAMDHGNGVLANEMAGDAAAALHAHEEAATFYGRALQLCASPRDASRFSQRIAQIATLQGDHALALAYYERALDIEIAEANFSVAGLIVRRIAGRLASLGRDGDAYARIGAFLDEYGARLSEVDALLLDGWVILANFGGGRPHAWRERLRALPGDVVASAHDRWSLLLLEVNADADLGDIAAWRDSTERLRRHSETLGIAERAYCFLQIAITAAFGSFDTASVRVAIDEARALCERYGLVSLERYVLNVVAFDRYLHGDLREARRAARDVLEHARDANQFANLAIFAPLLGLACDDRDLLAMATDDRLVARFWSDEPSHDAALFGAGMAARLLVLRREDEARIVLERAVEGLETRLATQMILPLAARYVTSDGARARIDALLADVYDDDAGALATRAMVRAIVAKRSGSRERVALERDAEERYARLGWSAIHAQLCELVGMMPTSRPERVLRAVANSSVECEPPPASRALSPREVEIAAGVAAGLTNAAIAAQLGLSVKTVESHLSRIYARLEIRSRVGLATFVSEGTRERILQWSDSAIARRTARRRPGSGG